ncbi:MAG: MATE family efflux transporter [Erysipelotrichaceae bacterium]|nr:MATE family efflux transporter [Erysipelotrichaceae bacterium]
MAVKTKDILEGNILKQLVLLFLPVFLGYLCQQLYNTVDAIVVGKYIGKQALAAVGGSTSTLINLLVNFVVGLAAGVTIIIAKYFVRRQYDRVSVCVKTGFFLAIVLGFVITIGGIGLSNWMLSLMNVPSEVLPYSLTYMRIYFVGMIPTLIYNVGASILRAIGDTKRPLYFLICACLTNIELDILLVRVFDLGIVGVGISTVISQIVSAVLILLVFYKTPEYYHYSLKEFGFDGQMLKDILKIGLPSGIQSVLYSISNVSVQAAVNSFGTDTIAAYTAFGKIDALYWNFEAAVGVAVMTMVAQNYGAGNVGRVKKIANISLLFYLVFAIIISGGSYIFAEPILGLFTDDANVVAIGLKITRFLTLTWWIFAFVEVYSSTIKSTGHSLQSMVISAVGICVVRMLWLSLYDFKSVNEALYCYPISWIITAIAFIIYYFSNKWVDNEQVRN